MIRILLKNPVRRARLAPRWSALLVAALAGLVAPALGQTQPARPERAPRLDPQKARRPLSDIRGLPTTATRPARALDDQPRVRELYDTALELVGDGEYAKAGERLDQALQLAEGDFYELPYLLAVIKQRLGADAEARSLAERAAALRPAAADAHYLLGQLCRNQNEPNCAIEQFRTATLAADTEPNNPHVTAAWFWLGQTLEGEGYLAAAQQAYARFDETVWQTRPEQRRDDEITALLADRARDVVELQLDLLRRLERHADAIPVAAAALQRDPENQRFKRLYARALLDAGQAVHAFTFCREQLPQPAPTTEPTETTPSETPATSPLLSIAVDAAVAGESLDDWLKELCAGVSAGQPADLPAAVARRLTDTGQPLAAARLWAAIAAQHPDDPDPAWALATALRAGGELEPALTTLTEFVRAHPQHNIRRERLDAWLKSFPATSDMLHLIARLEDRTDRDFAMDFVLGTAAAAAEQPHVAEKLLAAALEARPDFALAHVARGWMLLSEYRWSEAQEEAQAAVAVAPELAAAHFVAGAAHAGLDENDPAEQAYRAALKADPDDAGLALALAQHYRHTGNVLASQRYFQQALADDPTNADALENLIDSYLAGNKIELAQAQLQKAELRDVSEDSLRRIRTTLRFARAAFGEEHLAELIRQLDEYPQDVETGLKLAAGLYLRHRSDEAYPYVERVMAQSPHDERATTLMARVQTQRLEFARAAALLEELVRRHPNRSDLRALLAECYLDDFRPDEARRMWLQLLEDEPNAAAAPGYRRRLLLSYVDFSEDDAALTLLDQWIDEYPEDDIWPLEKIRVLLLADRPQEALDFAVARLRQATGEFEPLQAELNRIAEQFHANPQDADLRARGEKLQDQAEAAGRKLLERRAELVQLGLEARQYTTVEEQVREWLAGGLDDGQNRQWLVQLLIADSRPDEALAVLKEFQAPTPVAAAAARGWHARAQAAAGRVAAADDELKALLDEHPSALPASYRPEVWQERVELLLDARQFDRALECCDQWFAEADPADPQTRVRRLAVRSSILQQAGRMDEYIATAEQLLELSPEDAGLNNDLGYTWIDANRNLARATQMIRKALARQPLRAAYLDSLGWASYKAGDFAAAGEYLRRAVRLREGQDPTVLDHLGDAEYRLGDAASAEVHWNKALELAGREDSDRASERNAALVASIRAKLAARQNGDPAAVAPTADEAARDGHGSSGGN